VQRARTASLNCMPLRKVRGGGDRLCADDWRLQEAVCGLASRSPELSAATGLPDWQKRTLAALAAGAGCGALLAPESALIVLLAVMAIPFLLVVALRGVALWHLLGRAEVRRLQELRVAEEALPLYTILVPLFREAPVVPQLVCALETIDYPRDKLEVLLIVESIDGETQAALRKVRLDRHMRVLVVPDGSPRTKPRALQYALQFAKGDYVVVYDAEDVPAPDQLRRALAALSAAPDRLGCLQA